MLQIKLHNLSPTQPSDSHTLLPAKFQHKTLPSRPHLTSFLNNTHFQAKKQLFSFQIEKQQQKLVEGQNYAGLLLIQNTSDFVLYNINCKIEILETQSRTNNQAYHKIRETKSSKLEPGNFLVIFFTKFINNHIYELQINFNYCFTRDTEIQYRTFN